MNNSPAQNKGIVEILATAVIAAALIGGILGSAVYERYFDRQAPLPQAGAVNTVGGVTYYLHGSGVGASDTSVTLTSFKIAVSSQKIQMTDFGTIGYLTLEPGNTTRQEFISFSGVTQNADGTATLTGVSRGLAPVTPYTASSTLQKAHAGGTQAVISNPPQLYALFANRNNAENIYGVWTYSSTSLPKLDQNPSALTWASAATTTFITLGKLNDTALASAVAANETTQGYIELATQIEAASSTSSGGTSARLVVPTSMSTSSPGSAGLWAVITNNAGKIAQVFLDLTQNFNFTGNTYVKNLNASTTISIGGVTYVFPAAQAAASSSVLSNDASGNLSWIYPPGAKITYATTTAITVAAVSTSATSTQVAIPGGFLTASSTITIDGGGTFSSAANTSSCNLVVVMASGTSLGSVSVGSNNQQSDAFTFRAVILGNNSVSSQRGMANSLYVSHGAVENSSGGAVTLSGSVAWDQATNVGFRLDGVAGAGGTPTCTVSGWSIVIER